MPLPLVSIALCTYNGEKHLRPQLQSLLAQTYQNLEIICVDDQSIDSTFSILEEFRLNDTRLHLHVNSENLGYVKNFEKAISLCSGDYIALCDQDDIWHPKKIELMVRHIGNNQLLYHDSAFIHEDGSPMNKAVSDVRKFYRGDDCRHFLIENCVSGHASMFRKSLVSELLPLPKNIFHDWWLAYIATNQGSIDYIDQKLVQYRQHEKASTNILKLDRRTKKIRDQKKIEKEAARVRNFAQRAVTHPLFINRFAQLLEKRMYVYFCPSLFVFVLKNRKKLLYIQKKSTLSKFNFCLKYFWGYRLNKRFSAAIYRD